MKADKRLLNVKNARFAAFPYVQSVELEPQDSDKETLIASETPSLQPQVCARKLSH